MELVNTNKQISDPAIHSVVFFKESTPSGETEKKYPVFIVEGKYLDPFSRRVSNFWYWRRVNADGSLEKEIEHGYGNFYKAEGYKVEHIVTFK